MRATASPTGSGPRPLGAPDRLPAFHWNRLPTSAALDTARPSRAGPSSTRQRRPPRIERCVHDRIDALMPTWRSERTSRGIAGTALDPGPGPTDDRRVRLERSQARSVAVIHSRPLPGLDRRARATRRPTGPPPAARPPLQRLCLQSPSACTYLPYAASSSVLQAVPITSRSGLCRRAAHRFPTSRRTASSRQAR